MFGLLDWITTMYTFENIFCRGIKNHSGLKAMTEVGKNGTKTKKQPAAQIATLSMAERHCVAISMGRTGKSRALVRRHVE